LCEFGFELIGTCAGPAEFEVLSGDVFVVTEGCVLTWQTGMGIVVMKVVLLLVAEVFESLGCRSAFVEAVYLWWW